MENAIRRAKQVLAIIDKAQKIKKPSYSKEVEKEKEKNFTEMATVLDEAEATANQDAPNGGGTMGAKVGQLPPQDLYNYKLSNLYYEICYYQEALKANNILYEKGNHGIFAKKAGDCLRHLNRFDDALKEYAKGFKFCQAIRGNQQLKQAILNSEGLTYVCLGKYDNAIEKYNSAIQLSKNRKNPLYYCNLGGAYLRKGDRQNAKSAYFTAQNILLKLTQKKDQINVGLTEKNVDYIKKTLDNFLTLLSQLQTFKSSNANVTNIIQKRVDEFGVLFSESLADPDKANELKTYVKTTKDIQSISQELQRQENQNLKLFYDGMQHTLTTSYASAVLVESDVATLSAGTKPAMVASKIASFLPMIGDFVSSGIDFVDNFIQQAKMKKRANRITQMESDSGSFKQLSQEVVYRLIDKNKELLKKMVPDLETTLLPKWLSFFQPLAKVANTTKQAIQKQLYGQRYSHPMQKYGHNVASELDNYISSGEIFLKDQKFPILVKKDVKVKRLVQKAEEYIKNDSEGKPQKVRVPEKQQNAADRDKAQNNNCQECSIY